MSVRRLRSDQCRVPIRSTGRGADRLAADLAPSARLELGSSCCADPLIDRFWRTAFQIASSHRRLHAFSADHDRGGSEPSFFITTKTLRPAAS